jgi:BirA family transcriptional regulator, biotin operon repressor / biotin---[acetyl-CoA-carboxylase] ligase
MIGRPRVHHRLTDSTNEQARSLAAAGAPHGTLVTADEQQAGRGRQGRAWSAPAGSAVLMSVVLRSFGETLPLAAAVAVCEALPVEAQIKWPNDVWISGRKVAGILVEARPQEGWAVLGIGVNVGTTEFPPPLDETATSLALAGASSSVDETLAALVAAFNAWLPRPADDVLAAWRSRDALLGRTIRWESGGKGGVASGINPSGALIVETASGRVTLDAGEVHLER